MNTANTARRVIKNTGVILIGNVAGSVLKFIVLVFLAKYLGANDFGKYSFVIAYLFFFTVLTLLGINKIVVREISKNKIMSERIIGNALSLRLLLSIAAMILLLIIINLLNYPSETKVLVYVMSLTLLFLSIRATYASIFEARLMMEYSALTNFIEAIVSFILILFIIFFKGDLIHIMAALVIASLTNLLATFFLSQRFVKPTFEFNQVYTKKIFWASIPVGLAVVFRSIYYRIDVLMLSLMKTYTDVGYYSAAYTLIAALDLVPRAIMMSVFPLMSRYSVSSRNSLELSYEKSFKLMLMISLPVAVTISIFSKEIILLIYENEFLPSSLALSALIWAVVFLFMNTLFANLIISMGREKIFAYTAGIMALVNIVLNYLLIPEYSYVGASMATVFTEFLGTAVYFYYIYANLIKNLFLTTILKLVSLNILLGLVLIVFSFMPWVLLITLAPIFYIILIVKFNCITKEEISLLKLAIGDRR